MLVECDMCGHSIQQQESQRIAVSFGVANADGLVEYVIANHACEPCYHLYEDFVEQRLQRLGKMITDNFDTF